VTRVKDRYLISAPVSGSASRSLLDPGDTVKQGDVLAEIAPALSPLLDQRTRAEAEARLGAAVSSLAQSGAQASRAETAEKLALQELTRVEKLANAGSLAPQVLEQAQFEARMRTEEHASALFAGKVAAEEVRMARAALGHHEPGASRDRHVDVLAPASGRVLRVQQKSAGVVQASRWATRPFSKP
jgi:HlyD family secretion protein